MVICLGYLSRSEKSLFCQRRANKGNYLKLILQAHINFKQGEDIALDTTKTAYFDLSHKEGYSLTMPIDLYRSSMAVSPEKLSHWCKSSYNMHYRESLSYSPSFSK